MDKTCEYKDCTACNACYLSCRFGAISMKENEFGYILPHIDSKKCVDCGKCRKVCHVSNPVKKTPISNIYAGIAKDPCLYLNSSSGGFASVLADYILNQGGVVYGASFDKAYILRHTRITDISELYKIQGSKYVESVLGNTFANVKNDIKNTITLFTGTPCQVAGLLAFLGKENLNNLLTLSFICGGVSSNRFLHDSLGGRMDNLHSFSFRKGAQAGLWLTYINKKEKYFSRYLSPYLIGYYYKLTERLSCFNCKYSTMERVGDLTCGDFWGLKSGKFVNKNDSGVSIVMPTTIKGAEYVDMLKQFFDFEEHSIRETLPYNHRLETPSVYSHKTKMFRDLYRKIGFNKSVRISIGILYWIRILKMNIKEFVKQVL